MTQEAEGYKERIILEAQGEVARFEQLLPEYQAAKEVTRQRLYIDMMEEVLGSSSKVLVDVKGGNNMMYLPLDKIMQRSGQQGAMTLPNANDLNQLRQTLGQQSRNNSTVNSTRDRFSNDRYNNNGR
jgi:membrane protease subunit HflK